MDCTLTDTLDSQELSLFTRGLSMYPNASSEQIVGLIGEAQAVCEARKLSKSNPNLSVSYVTNFKVKKPDFILLDENKVIANFEVKNWRFGLVTSGLVHKKITCKRWRPRARRLVVFVEKISFTESARRTLRKAKIQVVNGLDRLAATIRCFVRETSIISRSM